MANKKLGIPILLVVCTYNTLLCASLKLTSFLIPDRVALDTLRGPAPSLEAYANYKAFSQPTLLRSERRQAGKKEFVTSCTKLEEILEQALGLSESIPVPPATIISGIREIQEQCQKRMQGELFLVSLHAYHNTYSTNFPDMNKGKPIPPEDLIDLTNESDSEDVDKSNQGTSGFPPLTKTSALRGQQFAVQSNRFPEVPSPQILPFFPIGWPIQATSFGSCQRSSRCRVPRSNQYVFVTSLLRCPNFK